LFVVQRRKVDKCTIYYFLLLCFFYFLVLLIILVFLDNNSVFCFVCFVCGRQTVKIPVGLLVNARDLMTPLIYSSYKPLFVYHAVFMSFIVAYVAHSTEVNHTGLTHR